MLLCCLHKVKSDAGSMLHNRTAWKREVLPAAHSAGLVCAVLAPSVLCKDPCCNIATSTWGEGDPGSTVLAAATSCSVERLLL